MIIWLKDRLFELGYRVSPTQLTTDFELASINAFSNQFGLRVKGCHFHFLQAIRRAIDTHGLKNEYNKQNVQKVLKMWIALSFVPIDRMSDALEICLRKKEELFESLDEHIVQQAIPNGNNFLRVGRGRGRGRGRPRGSRAQRISAPIDNPILINTESQGGRSRRGCRGVNRRARGRTDQVLIQKDSALIKAKLDRFFDYFVNQWFEGTIEYEKWNHSTTIGPILGCH
ncbi:unnamed protein product [Brachionus calyciflorus]|uniref:MULE transposase domain-containing protein n=1 Tax=Brachionus calyciflorus TaxID=104777 RepID=A0A814IAT6_9BILA|nr:unnamed protein product [Brachionus calyciflorus]